MQELKNNMEYVKGMATSSREIILTQKYLPTVLVGSTIKGKNLLLVNLVDSLFLKWNLWNSSRYLYIDILGQVNKKTA